MQQPTISIVHGLLNTEIWLWRRSLEALKDQNYPRHKIEHIVIDGGSSNGADHLAHDYGCRVIRRPDLRNDGAARMGLGIKQTKGDIILFLEPDNIIVGKNWLNEMVRPFIEHSEVIGTFSKYNNAESWMPLFTRYCSLFGINDPVVHYLGKSDKLPRYKSQYDKGELITEKQSYSVVRFTKDSLPTLGDNGHMVRRKPFQRVVRDPYHYLHTDAFIELLSLGYRTYGVVNNSIIHYTGTSIMEFIRRRALYKKLYYDNSRHTRRYYIFNIRSQRDRLNLAKFILYSLTIVEPLMESIRGFISVRDIAWFLHPIMCLSMTLGYGWSEFMHQWEKINQNV